ncbi:MAG: DNA-protecting protein DprA [Magnetococcales bacterium]|nr:DNA-protecting protein DprA [Magnetococcales bacterium]MBF0310204.1 DNA-protecting protein DprA [Magnetococcales bacterium]
MNTVCCPESRYDSDSSDPVPWMQLALSATLSPRQKRRLLNCFGTPEALFGAGRQALSILPEVGPVLAERLCRPVAPQIAREALNRLANLGGRMILRDDADYPPPLREIADPPPWLFVLGNTDHLHALRPMAVVGTRQASPDGARMAWQLSLEMSRQGMTVVSGLAIGIDTAAHHGAIKGGGATVAVQATGLDIDYPRSNIALRQRIREQGCLITEAALGTPPHPYLFPARNRIISGLSLGVVVVEAGEHSGSLITARLALEQGRTVFSVPGVISDPRTRGTHRLLREGARLLENIQDILEEMGWPSRNDDDPTQVAREAQRVLTLLNNGPLDGNTLARDSRLTVAALSRILLHLEMSERIERLPGHLYGLRRPGISDSTQTD